jgi:drug/metabolite transporter (DMT)-like permease
MQCVANCDDPNPAKRKNFEQPVIQTLQMFVGESGCWLVVFISYLFSRYVTKSSDATAYQPIDTEDSRSPLLQGDLEAPTDATNVPAKPFADSEHAGQRLPLKGWKLLLLALPACCDIAGTTLMNVGLLFVAASIYQMTRGALVLFVGLFSVIFLKRHLNAFKWASLFIVVAGVAVVGLAGALENKKATVPGTTPGADPPSMDDLRHQMAHSAMHMIREVAKSVVATAQEHSAAQTIIGILLIAGAQIFTASQFVLEESIMAKYELDPLATVGWEGIFGFSVTAIGMVILHFAVGRTEAGRGGYFDAKEGLGQVFQHRAIAVSSLLTMVSIGGFNFFGLSVTRTVSATARSTIDTCRTLFIWVVSLGLGWETFKWLQVVGFGLLVYGTMLFNEIIQPPTVGFLRKRMALETEDDRRERSD